MESSRPEWVDCFPTAKLISLHGHAIRDASSPNPVTSKAGVTEGELRVGCLLGARPARFGHIDPGTVLYRAGLRSNDACICVNDRQVMQLDAKTVFELLTRDQYIQLTVLEQPDPLSHHPTSAQGPHPVISPDPLDLVSSYNAAEPYFDQFGFDVRRDVERERLAEMQMKMFMDDEEHEGEGVDKGNAGGADDAPSKVDHTGDVNDCDEEPRTLDEEEDEDTIVQKQAIELAARYNSWCNLQERVEHPKLRQEFQLDKPFALDTSHVTPITDEAESLLIRGIPHADRRHVWAQITQCRQRRSQSPLSYEQLVACGYFSAEGTIIEKDIRKDLLRSFPTNRHFDSLESPAVQSLHRILLANSFYMPDIGYCQGLGMIVCHLLLVVDEETAFWILHVILANLLPPEYFGETLLGVVAEDEVLNHLVRTKLPDVATSIERGGVQLSLTTFSWLLTAFASVCPTPFSLRIWDLFLFRGINVLHQVCLAMFAASRKQIKAATRHPALLSHVIARLPHSTAESMSEIIKLSFSYDVFMEDLGPQRLQFRRITAEKMETVKAERRRRAKDAKRSSSRVGSAGETDDLSFRRAPSADGKSSWLTWLLGESPSDASSNGVATAELLMSCGQAVELLSVSAANGDSDEEQTHLVLHTLAPPLLGLLQMGLEGATVWQLISVMTEIILASDSLRIEQNDFISCDADETADWHVGELNSSATTLAISVKTLQTEHSTSPAPVRASEESVSQGALFGWLLCKGLSAGVLANWVEVIAILARKRYSGFFSESAPIMDDITARQLILQLKLLDSKDQSFNMSSLSLHNDVE
eukprot:m.33299 g.33299  ORF g.33299 m.33299 type:complete len:816 (-) comp9605_c1_seq1:69-2516(-)